MKMTKMMKDDEDNEDPLDEDDEDPLHEAIVAQRMRLSEEEVCNIYMWHNSSTC